MASPIVFQSIALQPGDTPAVIVNAATGTGTGKSLVFTIGGLLNEANGPFTLTLISSGTFSVCTATLQVSNNGGTTWNTYSTADTASDLTKVVQWKDLVPGVIYQITIASFTGTSITVNGSLS